MQPHHTHDIVCLLGIVVVISKGPFIPQSCEKWNKSSGSESCSLTASTRTSRERQVGQVRACVEDVWACSQAGAQAMTRDGEGLHHWWVLRTRWS